ncbi:hypothetical protein ACHAP4_011715, partial [Fusarium culmorum]
MISHCDHPSRQNRPPRRGREEQEEDRKKEKEDMGPHSPVLTNRTSNSHDRPASDDRGYVVRYTRQSGTDEEDGDADDVHVTDVEEIDDLTSKCQRGKVRKRVRKSNPRKKLDVAKSFIKLRLDIGYITYIEP